MRFCPVAKLECDDPGCPRDACVLHDPEKLAAWLEFPSIKNDPRFNHLRKKPVSDEPKNIPVPTITGRTARSEPKMQNLPGTLADTLDKMHERGALSPHKVSQLFDLVDEQVDKTFVADWSEHERRAGKFLLAQGLNGVMPEPGTELYVIMGNDYPDGIMSDKDAAEKLCKDRMDAQKLANATAPTGHRTMIYWRVYPFKLDAPIPEK